ncbi:Starch-binding associating with outer membrane [Pustulibacterium marinum]|uniref:Starch-binding associating with outer membrane n=1 Tax=Pustulibacterium marinum TaxID=1224947 RepID=A0A1I7I2K8_9FLAO|nr:RagB/SusD family nutrient uptake outer membrane protein [Pustulibacterium marinum]SFU67145.1 Starch-binding associating with outer membrane [Pustulibacterium marinum]
MKKLVISAALVIAFFTFSCNDEEWLERDPQNIISDEQLWNDPALINSLMANYYNRLPTLLGVFNTGGMTETDEAMWSGHWDSNWHNNFEYGDNYGSYWDYGFIRDINLALDNIDQYSTDISEEQKALYQSELRFIRAFVYFELVKRMGGVPLVTEQLIYDYSGDPSNLQIPRSKEYEVYDFIYDELEAIKGSLAANNASKTRANTYVALALESRAMLYAGSLAKYNNLMSASISLPGEEVGIPADMADGYYTKSLAASQEIINSGAYALYDLNPDKATNFYEMLIEKSSSEVIFAKDYELSLKTHSFTYENIPRTLSEDNEKQCMISPSLSLVESFEYLDGSEGTLQTMDSDGNYIVYDEIDDIFDNKDPRLAGTVLYGGSSFKGAPLSILAGVADWNEDTQSYDFLTSPNLGGNYETDAGGDGGLMTGFDGPKDNTQNVSNTGFYLRKFVSEGPGASIRGVLADNWWPWFRAGEIYLNATEAAYELGQEGIALEYINAVRERAGFEANSLTSLSNDIIRHERRVELAFEDHRYFDLKRWRVAHEIWNGDQNDDNAMVRGIYPYRIVRPGHPDNNKYIYRRIEPTRFMRARFFRFANYYSLIDQGILNNNPLLVKNPFH